MLGRKLSCYTGRWLSEEIRLLSTTLIILKIESAFGFSGWECETYIVSRIFVLKVLVSLSYLQSNIIIENNANSRLND